MYASGAYAPSVTSLVSSCRLLAVCCAPFCTHNAGSQQCQCVCCIQLAADCNKLPHCLAKAHLCLAHLHFLTCLFALNGHPSHHISNPIGQQERSVCDYVCLSVASCGLQARAHDCRWPSKGSLFPGHVSSHCTCNLPAGCSVLCSAASRLHIGQNRSGHSLCTGL